MPVGLATFPNNSFGKFASQVTVAYDSTKHFTADSAMFLQFRRDGLIYELGARYDAPRNGLEVYLTESGVDLATRVPFAGKKQLDLRVQQTDSELIFSARPFPEIPGPGGWTLIHTIAAPAPDTAYHLFVGMRSVKKNGKVYFLSFCLDGEGVGGHAEGPILAHARDVIEAVRAAETRIAAEPPDFGGALIDVDTATAANTDTITALNAAISAAALQTTTLGNRALEILQAQTEALAKARSAVVAGDPDTARKQLKSLQKILGAEHSAMAALIGWKSRKLKSDPNILSLRCP